MVIRQIEIPIASDHAGFELKQFLKKELEKEGYKFKDYGTFSQESCDYPDFIHPLASDINKGLYPRAIIMCGTGNGAQMTANKYLNVRCSLCWQPELASLAREHNNSNIIALPAHFIDQKEALETVKVFLNTEFLAGRHLRRIEKIKNLLK
jgi:sugar-phosphate isomerases, RpiB/LacA/LacB family